MMGSGGHRWRIHKQASSLHDAPVDVSQLPLGPYCAWRWQVSGSISQSALYISATIKTNTPCSVISWLHLWSGVSESSAQW